MKSVLACVLAILVVGGGWLGWNKHKSNEESNFATDTIQASAMQTERQLKAKKEDGITFAEYFKRGSAVIEQLDENISKLEARTWEHRSSDRDVAVNFLEQCKAIVRSDQAETRLLMDASDARKQVDQAKKDLDEADNSVATEWALKRFNRASDDLILVLNKQIEGLEESKGKVERLIAADESVKSAFGKNKGFAESTMTAMKKSIAPEEPEKAKND